jgi:hypothetical protein
MTRGLRDRLALKVGQHYKEARYKKLWQVRLAAQMVELPEGFAVAEMESWIRKIGHLPIRVGVEHRWCELEVKSSS